ncbi:hypothetical protein BC831DRAFT_475884 [Entophlyctis helioformis]|nr:hypothetical protein BC831DRAFT_475884 [Entophlyctis helioformis]
MPVLDVIDTTATETKRMGSRDHLRDASLLGTGQRIPKDIDPRVFRWLYAVRAVLHAIQPADVMRVIRAPAASHDDLSRAETGDAGKPVADKTDKAERGPSGRVVISAAKCESVDDICAAMRVKRILSIAADLREEKDGDVLDQVVGHAPCFAKLPPNLRTKLLARCRYETHAAGKRLIKEGKHADTLYVVLLGECAQHHQVQGPAAHLHKEKIVTSFKPGSCFGEFTGATGLRTMSVTCVVRCDVVALDRVDWFAVMKEAKSFESYQVDVLAALPLFAKISRPLLVQLSGRCMVRRLMAESSISLAGDVGINIFFVIKGKCRITYQLPFIKMCSDSPSRFHHKYTLKPFTGQKFNKDVDEMVYEPCVVGELKEGDFFPPLGREQVERSFIKSNAALFNLGSQVNLNQQGAGIPNYLAAVNADAIGARQMAGLQGRTLYTFWPPAKPPTNHYTIVSMDSVECAMLPRRDLLDMLPSEVINTMMTMELKTYPSEMRLRELQESYLTHQGWRLDDDTMIERRLAIEIERDRGENKGHPTQAKIGINPLE